MRFSSKSGSSRLSSSFIGISQMGWLRLGQFPELPWHLCGILGGAFLISFPFQHNKPVLQGVRPDGDPAERGRDGGVVGKVLVGHHVELLVASNLSDDDL